MHKHRDQLRESHRKRQQRKKMNEKQGKKEKEITLKEAIRPFLKDIENSLSPQSFSPTFYLEGARFRLRRLEKFLDRVQERYKFKVKKTY